MKLSGSVQYSGSLPIAHALTMSVALVGISNPLISHFSLHYLGSSIGTGGCNRSVSLITSFKNFISSMPDSSTFPFLLKTSLTSICAFFISFGFFIISHIAQSIVVADVSLPAVKMS